MAVQYLNSKGSFEWDAYFGTLVTVTGKKTYDITPEGSNYCPNSRDTSVATLNNVTVEPFNAASFDDTYNLSKCTATGASPSVTKASVATVNSGRVSASVWLAADGTDDPGDITLTLMDSANGQQVTSTFTNDGTLNRYSISGYFTSAQTTVKLQVSWTSTTGVVYLDAWQIELSDHTTEYIDNDTATAKARTVFADPLRLFGIATYKYNSTLLWNDIGFLDQNFYPSDHARVTYSSTHRFYSVKGYQLNIDNVPDETHLVYRANKKAPFYTEDDASTLFHVPAPEVWTVIRGIIAYEKAAMYDIGSNKEAQNAMQVFENQVEDMISASQATPSWSYAAVLSPNMMR